MKSIVVGTAGHIDHGKSALVQALTGTDPDRLKEEKARGITIDLGFAHQTIDGINFAFVDVPGHERFVKNMLAGVGGIDLVVLVVAADESVMPQTREHFDICRLLRVPAGLVALTKSDLVDADTLELVRLEVRELVAGSFLDGAPIVPVSARTGDGLDAFRQALVAASARVTGRAVDGGDAAADRSRLLDEGLRHRRHRHAGLGPDRDRRRADRGAGRAAREGARRAGPRRAAGRGGRRAAHRGQPRRRRGRGRRARPGRWSTPGAFEETRLADAIVEVLPGAKPLKHGARVRFHQGTAEILGRVAIDRAASEGHRRRCRRSRRARARSCGCGSSGRPSLARGDRYILRAYSPPMTIAGGVILDPRPPRDAIRTDAARRTLPAPRLRSGRGRSRRPPSCGRGRDDRRRRAGRRFRSPR